MNKAFGSLRRPRGASLLFAALLLVLLALPASASAGFRDNFADSVASPAGIGGKDWVETFAANLSPASKETGEPDHAGYPGGHSTWISWHFHEDTDAQASACGANGADLLIAVYTGSAVNELTEVASESEETGAGCAVVRFNAQEGTTYRLAVDAKSSPGSTAMYFNMGRYPASDDFADAIVLSEFPTTVQVDPGLGGLEPGEPPAAGPGNSAWYRWTAGKSGLVSIHHCAKWPQLYATVFTGPGLGELTKIAGPVINGGICDETRFEAAEGATYSIRVEGHTGRYGELPIDFEWVPKTPLTVSKSGSGAGTVVSKPAGIECGVGCETTFYRGVLDTGQILVTLSAVPDPGSVFVGWSGEGWSGLKWSPATDWGEPECGSGPVCELSMFAAPTEVTAEFEALPSLLAPELGQPTRPSQASTSPQRKESKGKKAKCAKRKKKKGKKGAKVSKRRACKR